MYRLPEELCHDIFLRLPVKSLVKCNYVSKTWFEIISDPSFVKSHLNLTIQKNDPSDLIFQYRDDRKGQVICSKSYHSLISSSLNENLHDNSVELEKPFRSELLNINSVQEVWLRGSSDGLVCLWYNSVREFFLWNPATAEDKKLPNPPNKNVAVSTFGYDYKINDYMLVNVVPVSYEGLVMDVYTLRSNSWKSIEVHPYKFLGSGDGVFVYGTCHWLLRTRDQHNIVSLDITNQKFVELQLPKEPVKNNHLFSYFSNVGVLEGCLSVLVNAFGICSEVWVMQIYGVRESWTKRCVITHSRIINEGHYLRPMWFFKNGEILLMAGKNLVLFDMAHAICGEPKRLWKMPKGIENYVESLGSLNSGTYVKKRASIKRKIIDRTIRTRRRRYQ